MDAQQLSETEAALLDAHDTYEAYLTSLVSEADRRYLPDLGEALRLVELGAPRGDADEVLRRDEWGARKAALAAAREAAANPRPKTLLSAGRDLSGAPLLRALADRELPLRRGALATILFLRDANERGQEVSGYIDVGARLAGDEAGMAAVFAGQARLAPRRGDLSCYNWAACRLDSACSPNFEVVADPSAGLAFKSRRDRKVIVVDPAAPSPGDYTTRTKVQTDEYAQAVLFDHVLSRRT